MSREFWMEDHALYFKSTGYMTVAQLAALLESDEFDTRPARSGTLFGAEHKKLPVNGPSMQKTVFNDDMTQWCTIRMSLGPDEKDAHTCTLERLKEIDPNLHEAALELNAELRRLLTNKVKETIINKATR